MVRLVQKARGEEWTELWCLLVAPHPQGQEHSPTVTQPSQRKTTFFPSLRIPPWASRCRECFKFESTRGGPGGPARRWQRMRTVRRKSCTSIARGPSQSMAHAVAPQATVSSSFRDPSHFNPLFIGGGLMLRICAPLSHPPQDTVSSRRRNPPHFSPSPPFVAVLHAAGVRSPPTPIQASVRGVGTLRTSIRSSLVAVLPAVGVQTRLGPTPREPSRFLIGGGRAWCRRAHPPLSSSPKPLSWRSGGTSDVLHFHPLQSRRDESLLGMRTPPPPPPHPQAKVPPIPPYRTNVLGSRSPHSHPRGTARRAQEPYPSSPTARATNSPGRPWLNNARMAAV